MLNRISHYKVSYFTSTRPLSPLGQKIVQIGQKAAVDAIKRHKAVENPIYYKKQDTLIKELADGTRFVVEATEAGIKTIRKL